ncbi:hypothetical protein Pyn_26636 [Prunus yedoensis var. nudiflora]|uniref:Uncharacterized protein n=1 Tax=Prunus yedoensis var. nudiflora TaxID=2094558 RepID=A0A314UDK9_PRUYE|nr:hypothetical protein Pyn_26636 [Prunus yedoensis var. nudiflora]
MSELESSQFEVEDWEFRVGDVGSVARIDGQDLPFEVKNWSISYEFKLSRETSRVRARIEVSWRGIQAPSSKLAESLKRALD